jgi:hypothetical protein
MSEVIRTKFNTYIQCFKENNCEVTTTFEEYCERLSKQKNKNYTGVRVDYIASCGHKNDVAITNFTTRKTGLLCKACVNASTKNIMLEKPKLSAVVESKGCKIFEKYIADKYYVCRTNEGCTADILIKRKDDTDDNWIPIQLKVTEKKSHRMYSFRSISNNYKDMLMLCICLEEDKIWIFPYNNLEPSLVNLNISDRSKYNKYLVDNDNIHDYIEKFKDSYVKISKEVGNEPKSTLQKREQEYVTKRKKYIDYLDYILPEVQSSSVDFLVNNKKIQEKVLGYEEKRNRLTAWLSSNNGKQENGIRRFRTYRLGENDYYWFHSSIDDRFWIIPEYVLYKHGYISEADQTTNKKVLIFNKKSMEDWISEYEFNYTEDNKERIIKIFS